MSVPTGSPSARARSTTRRARSDTRRCAPSPTKCSSSPSSAPGTPAGDALFDRGAHEPVVVLRDEVVDVPLEQQSQHRVERVVRLAELDACAALGEGLESVPTGGLRPQWLTYGFVAGRSIRHDFRHALPRSTHSAG